MLNLYTNPESENSKLYTTIIITSHLETESEPASEMFCLLNKNGKVYPNLEYTYFLHLCNLKYPINLELH